ncbi:MAG: tRNA (adenosine(37)-N6)-dimethylallyltransferase MiaA [Lentisphaerae bacterium RIFOXYA12_FULL_48_11]|nr:MAG: tRNA (adenosine(37)-N6)-dimethylallyltransferase MiaA [Lentisphaerae bacterium RIFOXYA12_FULL_48_11]
MSVVHAYFLVGPTAVGKSAISQYIAEHHGYDIIAADSMQIYRGMDIGTAKPSPDERSRVNHYGIDLVGPEELFSVGLYRIHALSILRTNTSQKRNTIVVGGTGLYVKSLVDGLDYAPAIDRALKARWMKLYAEQGILALQDALRTRNPGIFNRIRDKQNSRRLIRALELVESGAVLTEKTWVEGREEKTIAGLMMAPEILHDRIAERVHNMYQNGLVEEVKKLLDSGVAMSETAKQAIGYAEVMDYLNRRCSREDAIARTVVRTRQLAKRQRTWFRHQLKVEWIQVNAVTDQEAIAQKVIEHWRKYGPTRIAE